MESELPIPVVRLDEALRILTCNPAALNAIPALQAEIGNVLSNLLANDDLNILRQEAQEESETLRVRTLIRSGGQLSPYELSFGRLDEGWICVLYKLREELFSFEFLDAMSHELRTPLTGVLGLSEALEWGLYGDCNEEQRVATQKIHQSGERLLRWVNGILDVARLEMNKAQIENETVEANQLLESVVALSSNLAEEKRVRLTLDDQGPEFRFYGDPTRLTRAVSYLADTMINSTLPGGTVSVGATLRSADVMLFARRQSGGGDMARAGGSGLELRLTKRLLEHLGGVLEETTNHDVGELKILLPGVGRQENS